MGRVPSVRMKPECCPSKFDCQADPAKRTSTTERPEALKKRRLEAIAEFERDLEETNLIAKELEVAESSSKSAGM